MTQAEIEAKAKVAAVDIIEWCCMTEGERDEGDPNFVSSTIAGLMREAYEAGQQESDYLEGFDNGYKAGAADQRKIDIDKAIKEFRHFIAYLQEAEYIERDEDNEVLWKEDFREAMEK